MLMPKHEILSARPSGMSPRRAGIIGGVALLHIGAVYVLITGMAGEIVKSLPPDITVIDIADTQTPQKPVTVPTPPKLFQPTTPTEPTSTPPDIQVAPDQNSTPINVAMTPTNPSPSPDTAAAGLTNTHSTPPYPVAARTAGHQGIVTLQITVGPNGEVTNATVAKSSGFPELDDAAVTWVVNHWKYKPAVQGGVTVTSTTQAAVKFDLQQARR